MPHFRSSIYDNSDIEDDKRTRDFCNVRYFYVFALWGVCPIKPSYPIFTIHVSLFYLSHAWNIQKTKGRIRTPYTCRDIMPPFITQICISVYIYRHSSNQSAISIHVGYQMISRANVSKTTKNCTSPWSKWTCSLWKIYKCLFIPNCTRKIIWSLANNDYTSDNSALSYVTNGGNNLLQLFRMKIWIHG